MSESYHSSSRAFVLGLDGIPWDLIDRWSRSGELPNFSRVREEGAIGPLQSTTPPTTPLAWPSIATGVWPDQHGIYGFQNLSSSYSHQMYTSADLRQPPVWEQVSPAHVGNVPMTYPPTEVEGTLVSGMMTPSTDQEYTFPPELAQRIAEEIPNYRISHDYPKYEDRLEEFETAIESMIEARRDLMHLQLEEGDWRLFFFVYTAPDRFQHLIWEEEKLLSLYQHLDEILGEVLEEASQHDATVYVVSDHGFGPIDTLVYGNTILEDAGYLTRRTDAGTRGALQRVGISRELVQRTLSRMGISDKELVAKLPRTLVDSIAERIPGEHALYDVDYAETTAFIHDTGACWVNDTGRFEKGTVPREEVDTVKQQLVELFESVTHDGRSILSVSDCAELFPRDPGSPDLVVKGTDGYEIRTRVAHEPFGDTGGTVASHRNTGIIMAHGPIVDSGVTLRGARVVDVAPTLLHGLGHPVPSNTDGRVLFDAFREDARPSHERVERVDPGTIDRDESVGDDFTKVANRLRGLGYME